MKIRTVSLVLMAILLIPALISQAAQVPVMGPQDFTRGSGSPFTEIVLFDAAAGPGTLRLVNGAGVEGDKVRSGLVVLNGERIVGPSAFKKNLSIREKEVSLHEGSNTLEVTLNGIPGSAVEITVFSEVAELDEAQAVELVRNAILPEEVPEGTTFSCLILPEVLPAGTSIEEAGYLPPVGAPTGARDAVPPAFMQTTEESFFFFLDLAPQTFYEHPVKYILVGKSGGTQVVEARWWPKINGESPELVTRAIPEPESIIAGNHIYRIPLSTDLEYTIPLCTSCPLIELWTEGFIVVQGLLAGENLFDQAALTYFNGLVFFNLYADAYLGAAARVEGLTEADAALVLDEIDLMVLEENRKMITIYIIAHGGTDAIGLGGFGFTAQQFRNKMAAYPDVQFNFLLGSCSSGSFVNNLDSLPNVRVIGTAVANGEGATPDWDYVGEDPLDFNIFDIGSEWTSSVLDAARHITADPALSGAFVNMASLAGVPRTSMLLYLALIGATGVNPAFDLDSNLDLSNRLGLINPALYETHTPQVYKSW